MTIMLNTYTRITDYDDYNAQNIYITDFDDYNAQNIYKTDYDDYMLRTYI